MSGLENVPGQCGSLVVGEDGIIIESKGNLKDDQYTANTMLQIVRSSTKVLQHLEGEEPTLQRVTVRFDNFSLVACAYNHKVFVVKRKHE